MTLDFDDMRCRHEARIKRLEKEVFDCIKVLNKMHKDRRSAEQSFINSLQTETHLQWKFDMHEFPVGNINLELDLRKRCVRLHGYRQHEDQLVEIFRTFQLPEKVDSDLSAQLSANGVLTIQAPLRAAAAQGADR